VYCIAGFSTAVTTQTDVTAAAAAAGLPPTVYATRNPNAISYAPPLLQQSFSVVCTVFVLAALSRTAAAPPPAPTTVWECQPTALGTAAAIGERQTLHTLVEASIVLFRYSVLGDRHCKLSAARATSRPVAQLVEICTDQQRRWGGGGGSPGPYHPGLDGAIKMHASLLSHLAWAGVG
jgi:hypothetical protein